MAQQYKGIELEIGGNTSGLKKALSDVDKQLNTTQTELSKVDRLLKLDPKNTELLAQKQKLLSGQLENTKVRLEALKSTKAKADEAMKNGTEVNEKQYRALQREIIQTEKTLKKLTKETSGFTKVKEKLKSVGSAIAGIGKKVAPVIGALVGLGTAATAVAATFESKMSNVSAISGATGKDLEALSEKAKEMGAKTKFSASESADAFSYMAMAGWKTEEMLSGIDGIMNLAAASGEDLAAVSDIVTDSLTGFGLKAEDSGHFADVLAAASSNANTNVSLLGESFKSVAPVAGAMGYSVEDVTTALGLMANAGVKGGEAGTSLRSVLTRLAKPTKEVQEAFQKLNVSAVKSDGSMKSLGELIPELQRKFSGLTEEQKGQYATMIAGKNAMSGFLTIVNSSQDDWNKLSRAISESDGTAQKMADTLNNNLSGQITILKSTIEGIGISIGEKLAPAAKTGIKVIQGLATGIANLVSGQANTSSESDKLVKAINAENKAWEELKETQKAKAEADVAEIDYTNRLYRELENLVDENGRVTDANKNRVNYILGELQSALGIELELSDNQIKNYGELSKSIDLLIEKRRAEIILASQEEAYEEAVREVKEKRKSQSELYIEILKKEQEVEEAQAKARETTAANDVRTWSMLEDELLELQKTYDENDAYLNEYYATITDYETNYAAIMSGDADKIKAINSGVGESFRVTGEATEEELKKQVAITGSTYAEIQKKVDEGVKGVTQEMADEALVQYNNAKTDYEKIGKAIPDGMQIGIEKGKPTLKNTVDGFVATLKTWFTGPSALDEHSPSKWSEKVGVFLMQGLAEGIKKDMSAEEALQKKISNLKNFISDEIKLLDIDIKLAENDFSMWELRNPRVRESEKIDRQMSLFETKIKKQTEAVQMANDALYIAVQLTGENSDESREWQLQLSNETLELEKLNSEMAKLINKKAELSKTSATSYKRNADLADAEYELWTYRNPKATEEEKNEKQIGNLMKKITEQTGVVQIANDALYESVQLTGENSDESREYQLQLVKEKNELEKLNAELRETVSLRQQMYKKAAEKKAFDYTAQLKASVTENPIKRMQQTYSDRAVGQKEGQTVNNVTQNYYGYKGTVSENNAALKKTLKNVEVALA